ncbi:metallophosphoesterase [Myceligenerans pegani]|uniref:Metallophosphoesterase n=1 Tax=Myceligenerans pegani TaxID=2776917 RepID=A0ABR9MUQ0_9MICO|nr:metallophosphoesterase [Myceligenerans sp. TRM 65318]MBE1875116.1 metallophosphoesterase [Myceligenerans sp. TRM 65318]MBE3017387.1 metallophosphoesterase [Myceligenerans sp. TRM 65318]
MAVRTALTALATVGGAAAAGLAYAHLESKLFTVRRFTVPVLAPGQRPVRVLHISDLHLTPAQHTKQEWVRSLAGLAPDVVINTGDNFGHLRSLAPLLDVLGPLMEVPGAFVMGSNDYFAPTFKNPARYLLPDAREERDDLVPLPTESLAKAFREAGWADLTNRRDTITLRDGRVIDLVGMDDPHLDRDVMPEPRTAVGGRTATARHLAGANPVEGETRGVDVADAHDDRQGPLLRFGVVHAPYQRVLNQLRADGTDLIFAGHTHGGQLCLPGIGALVTNCDLDRGRAYGLHGWPGPRPDQDGGEDSTWLHVSAGGGTSPYWQIRFACRPEATLLTLTAKVS